MTALTALLDSYRQTALTEREKGTYFERLLQTYFKNEPSYKDLFGGKVFLWEEWRAERMQQGHADPGMDTGIDLVAIEDVADNPRIFAIQAKFYAEDAKLYKSSGIDSFLSAMGKAPYTHGILCLTTTKASAHVIEMVRERDKPVNILTLTDLEASQIDWSHYAPNAAPTMRAKKSLRPHQQNALSNVSHGLASADRGKLIMACGTGKTFTGLKIAESMAGAGKRVLFLVPSLALLSQTLTEWSQESAIPLHNFAVCSDSEVGRKKNDNEDSIQAVASDLSYPATTNAVSLARNLKQRHDSAHMTVVYATYHSIDVLHQAQADHGLADFDLIICDEAHRTTGATYEGDDESHFVRVHDNNYLHAAKRLYMTATPRIFGEYAKASAEQDNVALYSMDDASQYGKELYVISFSEAVKRDLLVDYKVVVLAVEEAHVSRRIQELLKDDDNQLKIDDAAKIIGCWKALSKQGMTQDLADDNQAMKRAVAFCQVIEQKDKARTHKVASKNIAKMFQAVVDSYQASADIEEEIAANLHCEAEHVDGGMNALQKEEKINWLKATTPDNTCRILSNVRCLSEGVDVPALDAVLFLTPRNSQVDVVQSVGRVMRKAPGKKRGYIVLPVVIPAGMEPEKALDDNKTYKVVWQVLNALRSHDDRFDAMVNKLDLIGKDTSKMEVIAVTDKIQRKAKAASTQDKLRNKARGGNSIGRAADKPPEQQALEFEIGEIERAIYAKLVQKVGNRHHWEDWANDIAKIANTHIDRITGILENTSNTREREAFHAFAAELRDDLNDAISDADIIEMLAQHLITQPVFDALFEGYDFAKNNPMSQAMQGILDALHEHHLNKEADTLQGFYESVALRAQGIDNAAGKQKIVVELYDKFFRNAFPRTTERLGIVYTPVEVVDFILKSVEDLLRSEFGQSLGNQGVHIIDPFTGTGTFITRLLQSGLIGKSQLAYKYQHEIHANEIVLLAYYIAAINIEATYHGIMGGDYAPFEGICLTDTFQMYEHEDMVDALLVDNSARRKRQKQLDIRVIVGNPPYSVGQTDAEDDNQNIRYPTLDRRISKTYAAQSSARTRTNVYDSYIRAIRWASDRIGQSGIIGFVTNASFIDANATDGLRKCLAEEFSSIHVFHLRGNQRTSGELSRKEGGKIFGSGSRAPIAISLLVKNPHAKQHGEIRFHDIGDYLSREEKLEKVAAFASVNGIPNWQVITPDDYGDWIGQRDSGFSKFILTGSKDGDLSIFETYSYGPITHRDAWVYSSSKKQLDLRMGSMIEHYNAFVNAYQTSSMEIEPVKFVNKDSTQIAWDDKFLRGVAVGKTLSFDNNRTVTALYRPFTPQYFYFDTACIWSPYQMLKIFPTSSVANLVICTTGRGSTKEFCAFISKFVPDLEMVSKGQCFPLYLYDEAADAQTDNPQGGLFAEASTPTRKRRDAITDAGLAHFQQAYPGETLTKEDLFYYVYGLLHSPDYRERYADNLSKELPRIPRVKTAKDFWAFSQAGRDLAALHLNYETLDKYPLAIEHSGKLTDADYRVEKMKFAKKGDKTRVIYNAKITLSGIPEAAWDYIVNGKAALDWVMERQSVRTDKASGIVNDANDWAIDTMGNPKYPLELFQRVVTVSLGTQQIVASLPKLDI